MKNVAISGALTARANLIEVLASLALFHTVEQRFSTARN
jgi:hypothetical protein